MHQKQQVGEYFSRLLAIPHIHLTADLAALLDLCERKGTPLNAANSSFHEASNGTLAQWSRPPRKKVTVPKVRATLNPE
jgi:hypothetical protein